MCTQETAKEFLRRHNMFYEQQPFEDLTDAYIADMRAGLRGEASTLMMLPSFLPAASAPRTGESVLVLDAGGTNLRAGRVRFDEAGKPVTEALQKRRMPGTLGKDTSAEEMFRAFAELALTVALDADRACIAFSFPCECLPNGDGRIISMGKESRVTGAEGKLVCEGIETAMRALGASGARRWRKECRAPRSVWRRPGVSCFFSWAALLSTNFHTYTILHFLLSVKRRSTGARAFPPGRSAPLTLGAASGTR